jgi:hypothetical protein
MAYLVYRKLDRPESKTIYNLQSQLPAHAGISHNRPKWDSIQAATLYGDNVKAKEKRRLIYSVVTRKVYNYVFIEILATRGPSFRCKTQFSR